MTSRTEIMDTIRNKISGVLREKSGEIRQVEIPKDDFGTPKADAKPKGSSAAKPPVKAKAAEKSKPQSKPEKPAVKPKKACRGDTRPGIKAKAAKVVKGKGPKPMEHVEGDKNKITFTHNGQSFCGWVEKRDEDSFDIVVVKGDFSVVKAATKADVAQRVKAAAEKLSGGNAGSKGKAKANSDMVLPPEENPNLDD